MLSAPNLPLSSRYSVDAANGMSSCRGLMNIRQRRAATWAVRLRARHLRIRSRPLPIPIRAFFRPHPLNGTPRVPSRTAYRRNLTVPLHTGQGHVISSMSWNRMTPNQSLFSSRMICSVAAATCWTCLIVVASVISACTWASKPAILRYRSE
jgi:hypothetical protein